MIKLPAANGASDGNVRLLKNRVQPLALFKAFREADLAAAAAARVVGSAGAKLYQIPTWANPEQIKLAATLRTTADQLFKLTMRVWGQLDTPG
jgi:hypothetical protein